MSNFLRLFPLLNQAVSLLLLGCCFSINPLFAQSNSLNSSQLEGVLEEARTVFNTAQYDESLALVTQIESYYQNHPKDTLYLNALILKAENNYYKEEYDESIRLLKEEEPLLKSLKVEGTEFSDRFYAVLIDSYRWKGDCEEALRYAQQVFGPEGQLYRPHRAVISLLISQGICHDMLSDYEASKESFKRALDLGKTLYKDTIDTNMGVLYNALGIAHYRSGEMHKAFDYFEQYVQLNEELEMGNTPVQARAYANLGAMAIGIKKYDKAVTYLESSIDILKNDQSKMGVLSLAKSYGNLGIAFKHQKNYQEALTNYDRAIQTVQRISDGPADDLFDYQYNKAICFQQMGLLEQSEKTLLTAISIARNLYKSKTHADFAKAYNLYAYIYDEKEEPLLADSLLNEAIGANFYQIESADQLPALPDLLANYQYVQLSTLLYTLERKVQLTTKYPVFYNDLNRMEETLDLAESLVDYVISQTKITTVKEDKFSLLSTLIEFQNEGIEIAHNLYEQNKDVDYLQRALQLSETGKSTLLMAALKGDQEQHLGGVPDSIISHRNGVDKEIRKLEGQLANAQMNRDSSKVSALKKKLFEQRNALEGILDELKFGYPDYFEATEAKMEVTYSRIQQELLEEDIAMLVYHVTDDAIFNFVCLKSQPLSYHRVEFDSTTKAELENYLALLHAYSADEKAVQRMARLGHQFYQLLIDPAAAQLAAQNIKRFILVPDDLLSRLPFEALLTQAPPIEYGADYLPALAFLLKDYAISYSYSVNLLFENKKQLSRLAFEETEGILALAPSYDDKNDSLSYRSLKQKAIRKYLDPIPGVVKEVQQLDKIFIGKFLVNEQAVEKGFKQYASQYKIIHMATHGIFESDRPLASSLVLTENGDSLEDNFLYAYEVSQMDIYAELVVLSACETGIGKWQAGEGAMSLARSFMYAGVPSLLVSLWKVNDQSTAMLIANYYQELAKGKPKDLALQEAKLRYLEEVNGDAAHPMFWAAFVQLGNSSPIQIKNNYSTWTYFLFIGIPVILLLFLVFFLKKRKNNNS